uniref:Uncharacterized protein n=1 Tax=Ditylenchus dipsaci TaxID=166011 RepID=A0A915D1H5_9BILA
MNLYIAQQQTSPTQLPRLEALKPVLNNRVHAFHELLQQKSFGEYNVVLTNCLPFFTQPDSNNLHQAINLFATLVQGLYPDEKVLRKIS